ncbi:hypothetical protein VN12_05285 [Pirellula sp. SH-Sr6A]|nr:hypothetical protein VN12_05285 [Pirellula sp. SH-Sr6A]
MLAVAHLVCEPSRRSRLHYGAISPAPPLFVLAPEKRADAATLENNDASWVS